MPADVPQTWSVGTLTYTRRQLGWLFFWVLLADFTICLMDLVMPALLPLSLKDIGASNAIIGLVGTLSSGMNLVLNPIISTASDRHRGPRGRRLPFLLWPTPFVALFLILTGFGPALGVWLHAHLLGRWGLSAYAVTVGTLLLCMVLFQACNLFVGCVYWYIFADIVPHVLMGRFLAALRIVSQLSGVVWGLWIFGLADRYMPWIFTGVGLFYGVAFLLFCLNVKEGTYPPPPPRDQSGPGWAAWLKDYVRSCTSDPLWLWLILAVTAFQVSQVSNTYWIFFGRDTLGCSLETIGRIGSLGSAISIPLVILIGWLVDRVGAIPMVTAAASFSALVATAGFFHVQGPATLTVYGVLTVVGVVWTQATMMPMYIQLFPPARYGQFCSAVNMAAMLGAVVFNYLMGVLMDRIGDYRWLLAWRVVAWGLMIPALCFVGTLYRRHGGQTAYVPPGQSPAASAPGTDARAVAVPPAESSP